MSEVLPVMVATAGHVDHGKTALVKALTGCNTDRLAQEKERGLSIDIGFALCNLGLDSSIGIVDLPGHEDFIKNMVAGASSAKILLLVISADESVMPQTREHLQIVAQLTEAKILLVITKVDLVDKEYLKIIEDDARYLLNKYGLEAVGVHYTSVKSMAGLMGLREGIARVALNIATIPDNRAFRMFVERTFIVKGHGIVVTGVAISGYIQIGDTLCIDGANVRVRGIESYGQKVESASCGVCLAINVDYTDSAASRAKVKRGSLLYCPRVYSANNEFIVRVDNSTENYSFKRVTKCRLHVGTMSCNASIKLFGRGKLQAADTGFAHLKIETPSVLAGGDRFLIRMASPLGSVGGGVVLSTSAGYRLKNNDAGRLSLFDAASVAVDMKDYLLAELLAGGEFVQSLSEIAVLAHIDSSVLNKVILELESSANLTALGKNIWLVSAKEEGWAVEFEKELLLYHKKNVYRLGMDKEQVSRILGVPLNSVEKSLKIIGKYVNISYLNGVVSHNKFEPELKGSSLAFYNSVNDSISVSPQKWIAMGELKESCRLSSKDAQEVIGILLSEGNVLLLGSKFLVSCIEMDKLTNRLYQAFENVDLLDIKAWREFSGLSRNHAVLCLEYFDAKNITRRLELGREKVDN